MPAHLLQSQCCPVQALRVQSASQNNPVASPRSAPRQGQGWHGKSHTLSSSGLSSYSRLSPSPAVSGSRSCRLWAGPASLEPAQPSGPGGCLRSGFQAPVQRASTGEVCGLRSGLGESPAAWTSEIPARRPGSLSAVLKMAPRDRARMAMRDPGVPRDLQELRTASGMKSDRLPTSRQSKKISQGIKTASPSGGNTQHLAPPPASTSTLLTPPASHSGTLSWAWALVVQWPQGASRGNTQACVSGHASTTS